MLYDYQYDVAAIIVITMVFGVFAIRRSYITKANKIFCSIIICDLLTAVCDLISCYTISFPDRCPLFFNYVVSLGYLFFYNMMSVLFLAYIDVRARVGSVQKLIRFFSIINTLFYAVVIFSSPWTHWVAYFDADRVYCHGPVMNFLFVIPCFIFIVEIALIYYARQRFNRYQVMASAMLILGMSLSVGISIIFPRVLIGSFGLSVIMFFVYVSFENPAYYTYKDTQCLNRKAFYETVRRMIRKDMNFHIVAFTFQDYAYRRHNMGVSYMEAFSSYVSDMLYNNFKKDAFCITEDKYAIIVRENELGQQHIERLRELFEETIYFENYEMNVNLVIRTLLNIDGRFEPDDIEDLIDYRLRHPEEKMESTALMDTVLQKRYRMDQILHIIKSALENDSFMVYYQPIYNTKTGKFESAEALVRLYDEELGFINPEEMITIAEENGYIDQIGEVVFRKVCQFIQKSQIRNLGISYIEINLSPVQCRNVELVHRFSQIMEEYAVLPEWVNLEITETAQMANENQMFININHFSRMGVEFSIDDYGSGFAAADYLIKLPVSIVKIDKSILWMAMKEPSAMIVLKNTVLMLKELGKEIVVEGVESLEMVDVLTAYGCDFLQGYYYSKPIEELEFIEFLKKNAYA